MQTSQSTQVRRVAITIGVLILAILLRKAWQRRTTYKAPGRGPILRYHAMKGCPACKRFHREWKRTVRLARAARVPVSLERVMNDPGVQRFPTLRLHRAGCTIDYQGERVAEAILQWANESRCPSH